MLTAAAAVEDRVDGLNLGADDYLGKPFAFTELVARVRALARRAPSAPPVIGGATWWWTGPGAGSAGSGRPVVLTRKEFGVLEMLVGADGGVVSAEELLDHVWDVNADPFTNTVSVTVSRLRRKLGRPAADRDPGRQRLPAARPGGTAQPGGPGVPGAGRCGCA